MAHSIHPDDSLLPDLIFAAGSSQICIHILEEYAWRALYCGERVRDYCERLRGTLNTIQPSDDLRSAMTSPTITLLYPFITLTSTEPVRYILTLSAPVLSPQQLAMLAPDSLVDGLLGIADEAKTSPGLEEVQMGVYELVLEYVGSLWRISSRQGMTGMELVECISKVLAGLESELQCQGDHTSLRDHIFPAIRHVRFTLGFINAFQLVSRLKPFTDAPLFSAEARAEQAQLITAWTMRRLNAAAPLGKIYDELCFIRDRIMSADIKLIIDQIAAEHHIHPSTGPVADPASSPRASSFASSHSSGDSSPRPMWPASPAKKAFHLFQSRRNRQDSIRHSSPHKRFESASQSTSFLGLPKGFNADRRPSLPVGGPSQALPSLPGALKSTSLTSFKGANEHIPNPHYRPSSASMARTPSGDLLAQIMTFSDGQEVRDILIDHLAGQRLTIHLGGEGDWYFGGGRDRASATFDKIEMTMVGKKDVMELASVFAAIRSTSDLPPQRHTVYSSMSRRGARSDATLNRLRRVSVATASATDERGMSFELDSYYHSPLPNTTESVAEYAEPSEQAHDEADEQDLVEALMDTSTATRHKRKSTAADSIFSLQTYLSADDRSSMDQQQRNMNRASVFSNYTYSIREAHVEMPHQAVAIEPARLQSPSLDTLAQLPSAFPFPPPRASLGASQSEPNLITPSQPNHLGLRDRRQNVPAHLQTTLPTPIPFPAAQASRLRPPSPTGSFHSLLSALDLETTAPLDLYESSNHSPETPLPMYRTVSAEGERQRRRQNRQCIVLNEYDISPSLRPVRRTEQGEVDSYDGSLTPTMRHLRRSLSVASLPESVSTISSAGSFGTPGPLPCDTVSSPGTADTAYTAPDSIVGSPAGKGDVKRPDRLPLAALIGLFADPTSGLAHTRQGTSPDDVADAVQEFVSGEMRYADELGSGWDEEDQRRVIWLLKQISALIADPDLQYPVNRQIMLLSRRPSGLGSSTGTVTGGLRKTPSLDQLGALALVTNTEQLSAGGDGGKQGSRVHMDGYGHEIRIDDEEGVEDEEVSATSGGSSRISTDTFGTKEIAGLMAGEHFWAKT